MGDEKSCRAIQVNQLLGPGTPSNRTLLHAKRNGFPGTKCMSMDLEKFMHSWILMETDAPEQIFYMQGGWAIVRPFLWVAHPCTSDSSPKRSVQRICDVTTSMRWSRDDGMDTGKDRPPAIIALKVAPRCHHDSWIIAIRNQAMWLMLMAFPWHRQHDVPLICFTRFACDISPRTSHWARLLCGSNL
jgi:hypothetical protein